MPTPVIYEDVRFSPCMNVPPELQSTSIEVFYATTRKPSGDLDDRRYGNSISDQVHVGEATVVFGPGGVTWEELSDASVAARRKRTLTVSVEHTREFGSLEGGRRPPESGARRPLAPAEQVFVDRVDEAIRRSGIKTVFVYVHGAKVGFDHACELSAQLHHFLARAGAAVGYAWPTGQSLLSYGSDVRQGKQGGDDLARVVELLSRTEAEQIDLICYSAGARILSGGLVALREAHADLDDAALASRYRIDDVIFAAADISTRRFATDLLPRMYDLPRRIQIMTSQRDDVLALASAIHGKSRLGRPKIGDFDEEELNELRRLDKLVVIDTGFAERERGLQMPGHGYWFRNPWAATDSLMSLRFNATPEQRGLMRRGPEYPLAWYFPPDYAERVIASLLSAMDLPSDASAEQVEQWVRQWGRGRNILTHE